MDIDRYRLNEIEFRGNEWEFIHSLVYLKYGRRINILELGEGNYSLLFAICNEFISGIKKILSVDVKNTFKAGDTNFYEKKRIFSALANRGYDYVEHFQGDCFNEDVLYCSRTLFTEDPVDLFVIEYMNDDEYMDRIFDTYDFYFGENADIYYHNLNKSAESASYFEKISHDKKSALLDAGIGVGIIKTEE